MHNDIKDFIQRIKLLEASRSEYFKMGDAVRNIIKPYAPSLADKLDREIDNAIELYKKEDRIIWAIRWIRYRFLYEFIDELPFFDNDFTDEQRENTAKLLRRYAAGMKNFDMALDDLYDLSKYVMSVPFTSRIIHFNSFIGQNRLFNPKIESYVFGKKHPNLILAELEEIEKESAKERERILPHASESYDNAEKIIDFGDGFAWWNLNVPYCDDEGRAMGHCGNHQYGYNSGDRVLSLREESEVMIDGQKKLIHIPHLTFILKKNGSLGEMKGYANEKPKQKYHKYIVALINSDLVNGIRGGGYDPANNFSLKDLSDEDLGKIDSEKLEDMAPLYDKYYKATDKRSLYPQIVDELSDIFYDFHIKEQNDNIIISSLKRFRDFEDMGLVTYYIDKARDALNELLDGRAGMKKDEIPRDDLYEIIVALPDSVLSKIMDDLNIKPDYSKYFKTIFKIVDNIKWSKFYEIFLDEYLDYDYGANEISNFITVYFEHIVPHAIEYPLYITNENYDPMTDTYEAEIGMSMSDAVKMLEIHDIEEMGDYEDDYDREHYMVYHALRNSGSVTVDDFWEDNVSLDDIFDYSETGTITEDKFKEMQERFSKSNSKAKDRTDLLIMADKIADRISFNESKNRKLGKMEQAILEDLRKRINGERFTK